ncbi:MAG: electron transfer flavoprotein subunit alpha/FixB family protein [Bryobacteraceae bacterium]
MAIWILAEHWRGNISEITYEMLALGRELAGQSGVPLQAVLLGHGARPLAGMLGKADSVLSVEDAGLAEPLPDVYAAVLAELAQARSPKAILVPLTNVSLGIGTLLADTLKTSAANFCKDACVADRRIEARCVVYGGKIEVRVALPREPAVLGIWPGARPVDAGRSSGDVPVEDIAVAVPQSPVAFKRWLDPEPGDVDLTRQDVLVAVGRGIQSQDNLALAEELAEALGGAVCGSRPAIDQGWLPLSRQVGKSGVTVKPKLYIAAGISGAPEHTEGMKDSATIIAINTDPRAPIFNIADYGIVADVLDVLPALTAALGAHKS